MKKGSMVAVALLLLFLLTACGKNNAEKQSEDKDRQIAELQAQLAELQTQAEGKQNNEAAPAAEQENSQKPDAQGNKVSDERGDTAAAQPEDAGSRLPQRINIGDSIATDFVEITFDAVKSADEIKPDKPARVYTYQADKENETYLYVVGTIKNTSGDSYEFADNSYTKITFDGKYNYSGRVVADEGGDFSYIYSYLKPFQSVKIYWVFSVPDELIEQYKEADILIGFNNNFNSDWNKNIDTCDYCYLLTVEK